jgi:hypothetical protein
MSGVKFVLSYALICADVTSNQHKHEFGFDLVRFVVLACIDITSDHVSCSVCAGRISAHRWAVDGGFGA